MNRFSTKILSSLAAVGIISSVLVFDSNSLIAADKRELPADTKVIYEPYQLFDIKNDLSGNYVLAKDLYMDTYEWNPLGTLEEPFTGTLDGNGHKIHYLYLDYQVGVTDGDEPGGVALFSVMKNATIKDLGITDAYIDIAMYGDKDGSHTSCDVAGFAGTAKNCTIENCYFTGEISVYATDNCSARASAFGVFEDSKIINCYSEVDIEVLADDCDTMAGGIAALNERTTIENCYSAGKLNVGNMNGIVFAGGIAGCGNGTVSNCLALTESIVLTGSVDRFNADVISQVSNCTNVYAADDIKYDGDMISNKKAVKVSRDEIYTSDFCKKLGWDFENVWSMTSDGFRLKKPAGTVVIATSTPTPAPTSKVTPTVTPEPTTKPTAEPTSAPGSDDQIRAFVDRIYKYVLDREPEEEGANYWTEQLYNFNNTGAEVAQMFIFSDEFTSKNLNDTEFVTVLYNTFFGREPEEGGIGYWTGELKSGNMDRQTVADGFIYSQEWADTCALYGIRSGGDIKAAVEIEPTDATYSFVERMYTTAMNRESDEDGKNYWARELANFTITGEQVGAMFFLSDEMSSFKLSNKEFVTRLYKTFMDRDPETDGFNYWVGFLKDGGSYEDVVLGFTRSPEFVDKCIEARILPN